MSDKEERERFFGSVIVAGLSIAMPAIGAALLKGGAAKAAFAAGLGALTSAAGLSQLAFNTALGYAAGIGKKVDLRPASGGYSINVNPIGSALPTATIYGRTRVGGSVFYQEVLGKTSLTRMIAFANHEIEEFEEVYFGSEKVTLTEPWFSTGYKRPTILTDEDGTIRAAHIEILYAERLGTDDQQYVPIGTRHTSVFSARSTWGEEHRAVGVAYLAANFEYTREAFPNGVPVVSATVKGKKIYDPRTDTTAWSDNPALILRDYLLSSGIATDTDEIDEALFATAANICDETVRLDKAITTVGTTIVSGKMYEIKTSTGSTDFTSFGAANNTVGTVFVATRDGTGSDGTDEVYDVQKRYTCNASFTSEEQPQNIIKSISDTMAGMVWCQDGKWGCKAAKAVTPVLTFDEDDLRSGLSIKTRNTRREGFNQVIGLFKGEETNWQPANFPSITSDVFLEVDNNQESTLELDLPFVTDSVQAQRIAKISLYRNREQLSISGSFGMRALQVGVGDVINITNSRLGFSSKQFEVIEWSFGLAGDMTLEVAMVLQEISDEVFEWDAEERSFESNNTTLASPFFVPALGISTRTETAVVNEKVTNRLVIDVTSDDAGLVDLVEVEARYETTASDVRQFLISNAILNGSVGNEPEATLFSKPLGDLFNDAVLTEKGVSSTRPLGDINDSGLLTSADALEYVRYVNGVQNNSTYLNYITDVFHVALISNADLYQDYVRYSFPYNGEFTNVGKGELGLFYINDIADGKYTVRAKATNTLGVSSDFSQTTGFFIANQVTSYPKPIVDMSVDVSGISGVFNWTPSEANDLAYYIIRHSNAGSTWDTARTVVSKIARPADSTSINLEAGKYMIKPVTKSGVVSDGFASVDVLAGNINTGLTSSTTITESPSFSGSKVSTAVVSNELRLSSYSIPASGTYTFATDFDRGSDGQFHVALTSTIARVADDTIEFDNLPSFFDELSGNFDSFSASTQFGDINVEYYIAIKPDGGSFGDYKKFNAGYFYGREAKFQVKLITNTPDTTPSLSTLSATIRY